MALAESVAAWAQVGLNAGALVTGGVVWKMYFENLKATVGSKQAEVSLANTQVAYWREKANELEKRSPEVVERVLAERIAIRETEIERLTKDKEHGSQELDRVGQELALLNRTLEQTKGFREMLAMEVPNPGDPDYDDYLEYMRLREDDGVAEVEVMYLGSVGVDSGQLLITDPAYLEDEWLDEPYQERERVYTDSESGATVRWGTDFMRFDQPLEPYGESPEALIASGRLVMVPPPPEPETYSYSYNGACQATLSEEGYGELVYGMGHSGAGVAFRSGWGDGLYPVYGEKHDGRILRVYVNVGAEPPPLLPDETGD